MKRPTRINSPHQYDWSKILADSQREGHEMVNRLLTDFNAATNRFDSPGEALLVHLEGNTVVGVVGLNVEQESCFGRAGRIRRLYVIPTHRQKGLARSLVQEIECLASSMYAALTLNVGTLPARGFYEHLNFQSVDHPNITHIKKIAHNHGIHVTPEAGRP